MAETRCPSCGHSPIPHGAEECPRCGERFDFLPMYKKGQRKFQLGDDDEDGSVTSAVAGGLAGALSHHPWPAATALFLGAAIWAGRALGLVGGPADPTLSWAMAGLDVAIALLMVINVGPVKALLQLGLVAQLGVVVYLGYAQPRVHDGFYLLHTLVLLGMTAGDPGAARRWVGLGLATVAAAGVPLTSGKTIELEAPQISSSTLGFVLRLPEGAGQLGGQQLPPELTLPTATLTGQSFGFGEEAAQLKGVLTVDRESTVALPERCQALHRELGGRNPPRPVAKEAPAALGRRALSYELVTSHGTGYLSCARLEDGRFAAFTVVVADRQTAQAQFDRFAAGLSVTQ